MANSVMEMRLLLLSGPDVIDTLYRPYRLVCRWRLESVPGLLSVTRVKTTWTCVWEILNITMVTRSAAFTTENELFAVDLKN